MLRLVDLPDPVPGEDELLVKVRATTVTAADWRVRTLDLPKGFGVLGRVGLGVTRPRQPILGTELAGVVEAVGPNVGRFRPGDEVFAFTGAKMGCHAEYRVVREDAPVAPVPENLTMEEAACLPFGGTTALHYLRKARLEPGERVLVVGASGNVGTMFVQLAKHQGADVTGVTSTANLDLVASLGADRVIDYTRENWLVRGDTYDVVAETVGATTFAQARHTLKDKGRFLAIAGGLPDILAALRTSMRSGRRVITGPAKERLDDVAHLAALAAAGDLRPVVDRRYAFADMVDAHAYVESRRKRGSVVVTL